MATPELQEKQFLAYLEVYKHHYDLFVKATAVYLAALGARAVYIYGKDSHGSTRVAVAVVCLLVSLGGIGSCQACRKWCRDLEQRMRELTDALGTTPFPFSGAYGIIRVVEVLCGSLLAAAAFSAAINASASRPAHAALLDCTVIYDQRPRANDV